MAGKVLEAINTITAFSYDKFDEEFKSKIKIDNPYLCLFNAMLTASDRFFTNYPNNRLAKFA